MRKAGIFLTIMAVVVLAAAQQPDQQPTAPPPSMQQSVQEPLPAPPPQVQVKKTNLVEKVQAPTDADVYCSGFITSQAVAETNFVRAGWDTPHQTRFDTNQYVYLQGSGFEEGALYSIVRKLRDPNRWEAFKGQRGAIHAVGQPYADVAVVSVVKGGVRGNNAITVVKRSCEPVVPGDYAIPYVERTHPQLRYTGDFDPYVPPNGKLNGRIIMARDFDQLTGTGREVYLNVGADQGVKTGDYFYITRTYTALAKDTVDSISFKASTTEDTQANTVVFPKNRLKDLPRRALGDLIILNVSPKGATGMIVFALEDIKVGDGVEQFEPPPAPPEPVVAEASTVPTITCKANPDTVNKGESSTITCQAASPDNHPISISFTTTGGAITPHDNNAVLDTAQVEPSAVTVTGSVTDDRNQSASSPVNVTVQAPAAPPAPTSQDIQFKAGSAYVDNKAKAILDGVALQLQQQADATAVVVGHSDTHEAKSLALRRANNVKKYLTVSKGIDAKRVETRASENKGKTATVWVVPAGATVPAEPAPAPEAAPPPARKHAHAAKPAKPTAAKQQK